MFKYPLITETYCLYQFCQGATDKTYKTWNELSSRQWRRVPVSSRAAASVTSSQISGHLLGLRLAHVALQWRRHSEYVSSHVPDTPAAVESSNGSFPWYVVCSCRWQSTVATLQRPFPAALLSNLFGVWLFGSLLLINIYESTLTADVTAPPPVRFPESFDDLLERNFTLYARLHPVVESVTNPAGIKLCLSCQHTKANLQKAGG